MGKSGQGADMNKPESHIIDKPSLKSVIRKGVETGVTLLAWFVWVYMLLPLVTLVMWFIGLRLIFIEQFKLSTLSGMLSVTTYYIAIIALIWFVFLLWSVYNRRKFRGRDSRKHAAPVSDDDLASYFKVPDADLEAVKQSARVSVSFENDKINLKH